MDKFHVALPSGATCAIFAERMKQLFSSHRARGMLKAWDKFVMEYD